MSIDNLKYLLEKKRLEIMDSMVNEHVQSIKSESECENINSMYHMKNLEDQYREITQQIKELKEYNDNLENFKIQESLDSKPIEDFYLQLESIIKLHRDDLSESNNKVLKKIDNTVNLSKFNDEEEGGKYLDLHQCYQHYMRLKGIKKVNYLIYLLAFDHLFDIPRDIKNSRYGRYVKTILNYLIDYITRILPHYNINQEMKEAEVEFEVQWKNGTFIGWLKETDSLETHVEENLELSALSCWTELKSNLPGVESKCNNTNQQNIEKFTDTDDKALIHNDSFVVNKSEKVQHAKNKKIAKLETMVYRLVNLVSTQRLATIEKIQQMQI